MDTTGFTNVQLLYFYCGLTVCILLVAILVTLWFIIFGKGWK